MQDHGVAWNQLTY